MSTETVTDLETILKERVSHNLHPHVGLLLAARCNIFCQNCLAGVDRGFVIPGNKFMNIEIVNQVITQLLKVPGGFQGRLVGSGGEPSLNPDFLEIANICANSGLDFMVSTNGTLLNPTKSWRDQPKVVGLVELMKRPNVTVKFPMDFMHFDGSTKRFNIPQIMKKWNEIFVEEHLELGENYQYCAIGNTLRDVAKAAIDCGLQIDNSNAIYLIADWRPHLDVTQLADVANFIQVGPDGVVYENYNRMIAGERLGTVESLVKYISVMSEKIKSANSIKLGQKNVEANWETQAADLIGMYNTMKNDTN